MKPAQCRPLDLPELPCKKALACREGQSAYSSAAYSSDACNSSVSTLSDEDLIRSSSCRNSAVSSAIDFGGLGGKGITSDIGRTSLVNGVSFSCAIAAFLRRSFARAPGMRLK
jgi:hypothetical protein